MAEGFGAKPTVTVGNPTKKSDYDNLVDYVSGSEVLDGDAGLTLVVADFGKTVRVNNAAAKTVTLPSVSASNIGGMFCVFKLGAGNVTIQTADADTINGGAAGGTLICSTASQTWAYVILQLTSATGWTIKSGVGTWATSANIFNFGSSLEGTAILSTGETAGLKFLREDGDDSSSWQYGGRIVQVITDNYDTVGVLGTGFPDDDTKPQRSEGDEILSCAITPKSASSTILITWAAHISGPTAFALACLFISSANDALQLSLHIGTSGMTCFYYESAASTDARTYSIRVGDSTGNNITTNTAIANKFGAVEECYMIVMEILP